MNFGWDDVGNWLIPKEFLSIIDNPSFVFPQEVVSKASSEFSLRKSTHSDDFRLTWDMSQSALTL